MRRNDFLIFCGNYLQKITVQYVIYVCSSEARACLCVQTGARKNNSVYTSIQCSTNVNFFVFLGCSSCISPKECTSLSVHLDLNTEVFYHKMLHGHYTEVISWAMYTLAISCFCKILNNHIVIHIFPSMFVPISIDEQQWILAPFVALYVCK